MTDTPSSHSNALKYVLLLRVGTGLPCRGTNAGRPGEGGGEEIRWLKLNRDEVELMGPRSFVYEVALRRLSLGEFLEERIMSA